MNDTHALRRAIKDKLDIALTMVTAGSLVCIVAGGACLVMLLALGPERLASPPDPVSSPHAASLLVERINASRVEADLPPLIIDSEFAVDAVGYNQWLVGTVNSRLRGGEPAILSSMAADAGYHFENKRDRRWSHIGESVGRATNMIELHDAFVQSTGHARNIFDPNYTHVGVGVHVADGVTYATARFASID